MPEVMESILILYKLRKSNQIQVNILSVKLPWDSHFGLSIYRIVFVKNVGIKGNIVIVVNCAPTHFGPKPMQLRWPIVLTKIGINKSKKFLKLVKPNHDIGEK